MRRFIRWFIVIALGNLPFSTLSAQEFATPIQVNPAVKDAVESAPVIHASRDGDVYISYIAPTTSSSDIYFTRSANAGNTFAAPTKVTNGANVNADYQRKAEFAIDPSGTIHMVWMETRVNAQPDIWYARSTNKGTTWSTPISVCDDSSKYVQDFASIAVDSSGTIYVSFLDERDVARKVLSNTQLYVTKSTDGGLTWSRNKRASIMPGNTGGTCECCKQDIAVSPEGHVYIAFRSNIKNNRHIRIARSFDKGDTWETSIRAQLEDWTVFACPVTGPNITLDSKENVHIAWRDARDVTKKGEVYYAQLVDGSDTVLANKQMSVTGTSANWPQVVVSSNGTLIYFQQAQYEGVTRILSCYSTDGGNNWSTLLPITNYTATQQLLSATTNNNELFVTWQDAKQDDGDIFFTHASLNHAGVESQGILPKDLSSTISIYPNPARQSETINLLINGASKSQIASVTIYDMLGRSIYSQFLPQASSSLNLQEAHLVPGIYTLQVRTAKGLATAGLVVK